MNNNIMNILVIGAGKSGLAAAKLAAKKGYNTFLTESKTEKHFKDIIPELERINIDYEFGKNTIDNLNNYNLIITSPGVPPNSEIIKKATDLNIEIISELEFAYRYVINPIIAITGTNGKTTTTALTEFIINNSGKKAIACGNIGTPLSSLVDNIDDETILVIEASSYQLDRIKNFSPKVSIILNLTPDHISYHGNEENYYYAKFNISKNQKENDYIILNNDDKILNQYKIKTKAKKLYFSVSSVNWGIYKKDDTIKIKFPDIQQEEELMFTKELSLPGIHNTYNSMAAALAARVFEISNENIRDSLMKFKGVEHRLEHVKTINNIKFVNDSKATNINATWYALISYREPLIWIAGGRGDNNDYSDLDEIVKKNVKSIITIGEESDNIFNHFCTMKRCIKADNLEEAVKSANHEAEKNDIVLFTPACKSFDMFTNYIERGDEFKRIVNNL